MLAMTIEELQTKVAPILRESGVEYAAVFGSTARGLARPDSDIDILVRFDRDVSLLDHIGLAQTLEDLLRQKVDLITEQSLSKYAAPNVKKDLKVLYGNGRRQDLQ